MCHLESRKIGIIDPENARVRQSRNPRDHQGRLGHRRRRSLSWRAPYTLRSAFVNSSCSVTSIPVPTNPWKIPPLVAGMPTHRTMTNRSVGTHNPFREVETERFRQHLLNL